MGEILEELSRGLSHEHRDHGVAVASEGILSGTSNRMYIYMCAHTRTTFMCVHTHAHTCARKKRERAREREREKEGETGRKRKSA